MLVCVAVSFVRQIKMVKRRHEPMMCSGNLFEQF